MQAPSCSDNNYQKYRNIFVKLEFEKVRTGDNLSPWEQSKIVGGHISQITTYDYFITPSSILPVKKIRN